MELSFVIECWMKRLEGSQVPGGRHRSSGATEDALPITGCALQLPWDVMVCSSIPRVLTCWGAASPAPLSDALRGAELGSEDEIAHESAKTCPWASSLPAPRIHYLALRSIQLSDSSLSEARLQVSGRQKPSRRPMLGTRFFC